MAWMDFWHPPYEQDCCHAQQRAWTLDSLPSRPSARWPYLSLPLHYCGRCAPETSLQCFCSWRHLSPHTLPCPVLQYTNDTLILIKGDVSSVRCPKRLLDDFTLVTGLYINFQKSTFIPLNIDGTDATVMARILGCSISLFPQPYLDG